MFMQHFVAHYTYTYPDKSTNDVQVDLQLSVSKTYAYPGVYIGNSDLFVSTMCNETYNPNVDVPIIIDN